MPQVKPLKAAIIGSGVTSFTYLQNIIENFAILELVGCSDIVSERSAARAKEFGVRQMTNEEIFKDPSIEIVINLTGADAHYEINEHALLAGKHVYTEKMIANTYQEAEKLVKLAEQSNLRLASAPDTFLGGGYQTCRKLIDSGYIGEPYYLNALLVANYRPDAEEGLNPPWWPNGLYNRGVAMPADMGGYYINAMVNLAGPVKRVSGFVKTPPIIYTNPKNKKYRDSITVNAPLMVSASLEFESGPLGSLTILGQGIGGEPRIEVYGDAGMLICPDPNTFGGPVYLSRGGSIQEIPITHEFNSYNKGDLQGQDQSERQRWIESRRGIGVGDLAWAIRNKRPHRCSAELGLHSVEILEGIEASAAENKVVTLKTRPEQPKALPAGFVKGSAEMAFDED